MTGSLVQRTLWQLSVLASLGSALSLQACGGRVQLDSDCRSGSSCGGVGGTSGGQAEAGSAAVVSSAGAGVPVGACENNRLDSNEADVDCGGPSACARCASGTHCSTNKDCESAFCKNEFCAQASCADKLENHDETGVDCGGSCLPCLAGTATCSDQIKNQDESDIDCGGVCGASKRCPVAARCNTQADCESWLCSAGKCSADNLVAPGDVIDNFEDEVLSLPLRPALGRRVGTWYAFGDGSGGNSRLGMSPIERGASANALHAMGKDFNSWGSGFGVDLNNATNDQSSKFAYDASAYTGITFWARAQSPTTVTVELPDADTDAAGTICTVCGHHYAKAVQLTTDWQRFTIAFSELALEPGGAPRPTAFKPSAVLSLQFRLASGLAYDLYFDDLAFVKN